MKNGKPKPPRLREQWRLVLRDELEAEAKKYNGVRLMITDADGDSATPSGKRLPGGQFLSEGRSFGFYMPLLIKQQHLCRSFVSQAAMVTISVQ